MRGKIHFMYSIFLALLLPIFLIFLMNSGCGSAGGGAAYYETVEISANCQVASLDSDVALWEDSDNDEVCDELLRYPDYIEVTVQSQSFKNVSIPFSKVRIEKVRIDYTPIDDSPALASQDLALGQVIEPDCSVTLNIMIISQDQKKTLPLAMLTNGELYCNEIYKYFAKFTFSGIEINTNKQQNFSTDLTVQVADFISDDEPTCEFFNITANCEITELDSDVALWEDANGDGSCDNYTTEDDSALITIQTQSYRDTEVITLTRVMIDYTSLDGSPDLTSHIIVLNNLSIGPNSHTPLDITIISENQKLTSPLNELRKGGTADSETYKYSVKITFTGTEVVTNIEYNFSTNLTLQVSDFSEEEACNWD